MYINYLRLAAEPVCSEPVSVWELPCSAGNYQGIFARISFFGHICFRQATAITALFQQIPYTRDQGSSSAEQWSQVAEQRTANCGTAV